MIGLFIFFIKHSAFKEHYVKINLQRDFEEVVQELMKEGNDIKYCFDRGRLKLVANNFTIETNNIEDVIYEFDMDKLDYGEAGMTIYSDLYNKIYDTHKSRMCCYNVLDFVDYVDIYNKGIIQNEENVLFQTSAPHWLKNQMVTVKMFLVGNILRIEKTCVPLEKDLSRECSKENSNKNIVKIPDDNFEPKESELDSVIIDDFCTLKMHEKNLLPTIYFLEKSGVEYDVTTKMMGLHQHFFYVSCLKIQAEDFSLIYYKGELLGISFNDRILDTSYFVTTKGIKHNLREIIKKEVKNTKVDGTCICGYGADDAFHFVWIYKDGTYKYSISYDEA